jgi:hypothetical protein
MSVRVPGTMPACLIDSSMATSLMMTTSAGSVASRWRVTPTVPKASDTLWPVSFSNACDSSVTIARTAPALSTRISAASPRPGPASIAVASTITPSLRVAEPLIVILIRRGSDSPTKRSPFMKRPPSRRTPRIYR